MDSAMGYSMRKNKTYHRKKTVLLWVLCMGMMVGLAGRLVYLCVFRSVYYSEKADDVRGIGEFYIHIRQKKDQKLSSRLISSA